MKIRWAYLKRVLAGAIFGLYMAHLLYFLNPQIDITPARLVTVTLIYGLICGLLFGTALWLLRLLRVKVFGRPESEGGYRAHGFGFVVLAAFIAAALYWMHLYVFRVGLLPIGAVRVLAKATNLITSTAFALLLLWFLERNADRRQSRIIFLAGVLLIAISAFFLYQRRDSYRTEKQSVVVANVGTIAGERPVIVVAVRNLPYDWILTLTGEGSLPFFEQARKSAYFTRLEPFPTLNPSALWASLATGKLPFRHGVTGRFAYRTALNSSDPSDRFLIVPSGVGFRVWGLIPPIDRISAQLPAGDALPLWTLFQRVGLRAAVIGWPAAGPPSLVAISPSAGVVQRFNGAGRARDRIVRGLGADLAAAVRIRSAASGRDVAVVMGALNGFEEAQRAIHIFTNDLPSRSTMKGEVLRAYAEQIDLMLASIARQFPDHLLVIVSPSGPVPQPLPTTPYALLRDFVASPDPGADDGFVLIAGSGVAHPERPLGAAPEDVVPTVLYAAGLPVGRDMDGRVLTDAFTDEQLRGNPLSVVQTYEARQLVVRSHS
jgi:type I phosphodiesterase/nucleotide pyrophosphatase